MKLVESTIREDMVWYSISADAVEFYLDTKEIKDESRINVSQLLLEKMINSITSEVVLRLLSVLMKRLEDCGFVRLR